MYTDFSNIRELVKTITDHNQNHPGLQLILLSDSHQHQAEDLVAELKSTDIEFFGAVFPGLLVADKVKDQGAVIHTLHATLSPIVARLSEDSVEWESSLPLLSQDNNEQYSAFIFVDSQAQSISMLFDKIYHEYGSTINYFGAGVGNSDLAPGPCVFSNSGLYQNAAIMVISQTESETSVKHGWRRLHGPFVATRTSGRVIKEINWEPAIEVYRKYLPERLHQYLKPDDPGEFYQKISLFPFAIVNEGCEDIVRDVIGLTTEGELICISDVPQNSIMHILTADMESLVAAAKSCITDLNPHSEKSKILIFDCYSRMLFLGTQFSNEIHTVKSMADKMDSRPEIEGALALGEIASDGSQVLQFYNKTCVTNLRE